MSFEILDKLIIISSFHCLTSLAFSHLYLTILNCSSDHLPESGPLFCYVWSLARTFGFTCLCLQIKGGRVCLLNGILSRLLLDRE